MENFVVLSMKQAENFWVVIISMSHVFFFFVENTMDEMLEKKEWYDSCKNKRENEYYNLINWIFLLFVRQKEEKN